MRKINHFIHYANESITVPPTNKPEYWLQECNVESLVDMYLYTLHIFHDMFSIIWLVVNCNGHLDRDLNDDDTIQTELLYQANTVSQEKRSDDQTQKYY